MKTTPEHSHLLEDIFGSDHDREFHASALEAGLASLRRRRRTRAAVRVATGASCILALVLLLPFLLTQRPAPTVVSDAGIAGFEIVSTRKIDPAHLVERPAQFQIDLVNTRADALARIPCITDAELLDSFGQTPRMLVRYGTETRLILLEPITSNEETRS